MCKILFSKSHMHGRRHYCGIGDQITITPYCQCRRSPGARAWAPPELVSSKLHAQYLCGWECQPADWHSQLWKYIGAPQDTDAFPCWEHCPNCRIQIQECNEAKGSEVLLQMGAPISWPLFPATGAHQNDGLWCTPIVGHADHLIGAPIHRSQGLWCTPASESTNQLMGTLSHDQHWLALATHSI